MPRDDDDQPWNRGSRSQDDDDDDRPRPPSSTPRRGEEEDDDFDYDPRPSRGLRARTAGYRHVPGIIVCILLNLCLFAVSFMMEEDNRVYLLIGYVPIAARVAGLRLHARH